MPNETKDKTTLEKLKELQENDTISSLDFEEPELKTFDVTNIFEIDDEQKKPEKKKFTFGKRANRHASQVKIKTNEFDNTQPIIEDIRFSQELKDIEGDSPSEPEEVVENQPEPVQEQPLEKENISEETAKPVIEDKEVVEEVITSEVVETPETIEEDVEEVEEFEETEDIDEEVEEYDEEDEVEEEEINDSDETEAVFNEEEDELFMEKKKFLLSQYQKQEAYLEQKSKEGYHFVRHVGKKFYFYPRGTGRLLLFDQLFCRRTGC